MKENYTYPAELTKEDGKVIIRFLDFPDVITIEEETQEAAIKSAQEVLALEILDYESQGKELPETIKCRRKYYIYTYMDALF